jgi:hypothetical protein
MLPGNQRAGGREGWKQKRRQGGNNGDRRNEV